MGAASGPTYLLNDVGEFMGAVKRSTLQKIKDFLTFPIRALILYGPNRWGLTSLPSERYDYAAREVRGYCLDVGCGKFNRFVTEYLGGHGKGIDVFPFEGLSKESVLSDMTRFPFPDQTFDSVTFIASINHVPKPQRDSELAEAFRCLKPGGNVIVTMGNPLAEILTHRLVRAYDKLFGTTHDLDGIRGMDEEEEYYLTDSEITARISRAGFADIRKRHFWTQWGLNHLFVGWRR